MEFPVAAEPLPGSAINDLDLVIGETPAGFSLHLWANKFLI